MVGIIRHITPTNLLFSYLPQLLKLALEVVADSVSYLLQHFHVFSASPSTTRCFLPQTCLAKTWLSQIPLQSANATKENLNAVLVYQRGLYQSKTKRTETSLLTLPVCHILFGVEGRTPPVLTVPTDHEQPYHSGLSHGCYSKVLMSKFHLQLQRTLWT